MTENETLNVKIQVPFVVLVKNDNNYKISSEPFLAGLCKYNFLPYKNHL